MVEVEHHSAGTRAMILTPEQILFCEMEMNCLNSEARCDFQHDCVMKFAAQPADTLTCKLNKYTYIICPICYLHY